MNESFSVGRALSLGFSTMFRNIIPFVFLSALVYTPLVLYTIHAQGVMENLEGGGREAAYKLIEIGLVIVLLSWVLKTMLGASVTYGVVMQVRGQPAGIGPSVVKGISRLLPVLLIGILVALITVGPMILLAFVSPILMIAWVPFAVVLYCMYYVAVPASVCEKPGIGGALLRSRDLTSGHKGGIFGMLLVLGLMGFGINKILESMFERDPKMFMYASLASEVILGLLAATVCASTYYLLRSEKEGTSAEDLASVFD